MKLKNLPVILGFVILLLTLPAAVFLLSQRQESRIGAKLSANALVYLWPQRFELPRDQSVTLEVKVDTKDQLAKRVEATITFDPQLITIENTTIKPASGVRLAQKALNHKTGILQLSGVGDFRKVNTLATFKIKGRDSGITELKIQEAHVWDPSGQVDIFENAMDAEITIQ